MDDAMLGQLMEWVRGRFFGKYRGTVTATTDQTARGRLKVKVPAVLGSVEVWAMPCVPYAGKKVGFYALPEAGSGVWVEFEGGDPSYPIWTGFFWADEELPGASDASKKIFRTKELTLSLDDSAKRMKAESTSGASLSIDDKVLEKAGSSERRLSPSNAKTSVGPKSTELTSGAFSVNGGTLEVT